MTSQAVLEHTTLGSSSVVGLTPTLQPDQGRRRSQQVGIELKSAGTTALNAQDVDPRSEDPASDDDDAITAQNAWLKLFSCSLSFFCAGIDGGSLGTLIPYFSRYYNISLGSVAIVYGASFAGWCVAGVGNSILMERVGFGSILILGAFLQLVAQSLRFWTPPFAVYSIGFFLSALGLGFQDSHSNTLVSTFKGAHRWLGLIHGLYSCGMVVAPFAANGFASRNPERWGLFYVVPLSLAVLNMSLVTLSFKDSIFRQHSVSVSGSAREPGDSRTSSVPQPSTLTRRLLRPLKLPGTWQMSLWFFFYTGAATVQYGWLVEFLVTVRHGKLSQMGYVPTGAFGGSALGRILLPEVFYRFGERRSVIICHGLWIAGQIIVLTVPNIPVTVVVVTLMSFVGGPFFPVAITIGGKLFSKEDKPAALGFVFIASQAGGALFPTITGLIADSAGVRVLQPIAIGLMVAAVCTWLLIPRPLQRME